MESMESRDGEAMTREAVRFKYIEGRMAGKPDRTSPSSGMKECCARIIRTMRLALGLTIVVGLVLSVKSLLRHHLVARKKRQQNGSLAPCFNKAGRKSPAKNR